MKKILILFFCLLLLIPTASIAQEDAVQKAQTLREEMLSRLLNKAGAPSVQEWIDGELTQNAGSSAEWYIIALKQSGRYDFSGYQKKLLDYAIFAEAPSAVTRQKYALVMLLTGMYSSYVDDVAADSIGQQGVMSWIYGLHLLNNGCDCPGVSSNDAVEQLLSMQLEDGGWAVSGPFSDVDVTAMAIQALTPDYAQNESVRASVDKGVALLSARQTESGGYSSYGVENPESAAQVLTALSGLGIDGLKDERFIKNGKSILDGMMMFQHPEGGFRHIQNGPDNPNATTQVFLALTAYQRMLDGKPGIYLADENDKTGKAEISLLKTEPKTVALLIAAGLVILSVVIMLVLKKRSWKNYAAIFLIGAIVTGIIWGTDFQSAENYYGQSIEKENPVGTVEMSIRCDSVCGLTDAEYIPVDGVILGETSFSIAEGDTVYSILTQAARSHGIHMETSGAAWMRYVSGIQYLYEFAFGDLSGWIYRVNGETASVGCEQYVLKDGDKIEWAYTLEMGNDLK